MARRILSQFAASLVLLLVAGSAVAGQEQRQGAAAGCASCHRAQAQTQPRTSMGRALQLPGSNSVLASHPKLTFEKNGYSYVVETKNGETTYSVTDGTRTIALSIRWSFGNGAQTWVFERDGVYYESLVSYYPSVGGLGITIGDSNITPRTLEQALGRRLAPNEPSACFRCHSTGGVMDGQWLTFDSLEPGVTCEHCHVGAASHMLSGLSGAAAETAPPDLGKLSSEDLADFCGQCHRSWEKVIRGPWRGELDVNLRAPEFLPAVNVAGAALADHHAVLNRPLGGRAVAMHPAGQVFAVEKHDGVGRRPSRRTRINHGWFN